MICVDRLRHTGWRYRRSCHLFAIDEPVEALFRFAAKLNLKRAWFQGDPRLPHYDLTASKRKRAIELGAVEVADRYVKEIIKDGR